MWPKRRSITGASVSTVSSGASSLFRTMSIRIASTQRTAMECFRSRSSVGSRRGRGKSSSTNPMEAIMAERQDVATRESSQVQGQAREKTREDELVLAPPVDIFEDRQGITVLAEMPGVSKERLNVQADRNSLVIEGDVAIDMPAAMEAVY